MKKLTKLLCAALVWALLLGAAVSCAKQPDSPVQDPPKQEDPQPAPAAAAGLRIAVDSEPAWSAAVQWLASEQGQALFGDADVHDVFFLVAPQDITQQLRLSNYDAAILCPDQQTLQQLGGYESIPLFRDAVIFVHGDIGQPRGDYDLTADTIRQIYAGSGALFWDQEQRQALIPAYGYSDDADVPVDAVRHYCRCAGYCPGGRVWQPRGRRGLFRPGGSAAVSLLLPGSARRCGAQRVGDICGWRAAHRRDAGGRNVSVYPVLLRHVQRHPARGEKAAAGDIPGHTGKQCPVKSQPIRGATYADVSGKLMMPISIHAPHTGRDFSVTLLIPESNPFQSTCPMRGAT